MLTDGKTDMSYNGRVGYTQPAQKFIFPSINLKLTAKLDNNWHSHVNTVHLSDYDFEPMAGTSTNYLLSEGVWYIASLPRVLTHSTGVGMGVPEANKR